MRLAGLQTERIARALGELGPERARGGAPLSGRDDRCRRPRRRAEADRPRRPRARGRAPERRGGCDGAVPLRPPADDAPHLLVVDDDRRIRDLLSRFLVGEGYRITTADSAAKARAKLDGLSFDLLILDVMMPGETGFEFAKIIRKSSAVPILMLTARDAAESRITGLEIGADDYVRQAVRAARAVAAHRQHPQARASPPPRRRPRSVRFGPFVFHIGARRAAQAATRSSASPTASARCCACWRRRPAKPCRGRRWPATAAPVNERAVDVQVNRLRRKIERDPANPLFVQTVRGIGYRLVVVAMTSLDVGFARLRSAAIRVSDGWVRFNVWFKALDAEGALRPFAADHHRADGDPAVGGRLRVHGAALEHGDAHLSAAVVQDIAALVEVYKSLSAGSRQRAAAADRAGPARPRGRFPAAVRHAAAGAETVLLAARSGAVGGAAQADRPAVLDRHGRPLEPGRDPHPARQRGDAGVRAAQRRLRLELRNLPARGWSAPRWCCSPSPSCSCATRSGRSCGSPTPPRASARAAKRRTSGRAARARCAAPRRPSSR